MTLFDQEMNGWLVPDGYTAELREPPAHCRSCGAEVLWAITRNAKRMPLNRDGSSHFSNCPDADRWRRRK